MSAQEKKQNRLWYLKTEAGVQGPFPSGAVRRSLLLGRLRVTDLVSTDGDTWQPIAEVPEVVPAELRGKKGEGRERLDTARSAGTAVIGRC